MPRKMYVSEVVCHQNAGEFLASQNVACSESYISVVCFSR